MRKLIFWQWYYVARPALSYTAERLMDHLLGPVDFDIETYIHSTQPRTPPPQWP